MVITKMYISTKLNFYQKLQLCKSECGKDKAPKRDFNAQYFDNQISLFLYENFNKFGIQRMIRLNLKA